MKSSTVWHGRSTQPSLPAGTARKAKENLLRGRRNRPIMQTTNNRKFPLAGYSYNSYREMTWQLPVRIGYEYPARPRNHQVPCSHRQCVEHGTFCISGVCTPLSRCNTLDFVPKPCAKGTASLGIPAHIAHGRCGFAAQKALAKAHPAVCGEEKALLRKCNNPL